MATNRPRKDSDEPQVQLATRIPRALLLRMRLHCVKHELTIMDFVADALREKLHPRK